MNCARMRWSLINCLLLAALASSETRQKRDLNYLTNLFTSIFERQLPSSPPSLNIGPEYRFFRAPGLGHKLFNVATKDNPRIEVHPTINNKHNEASQVNRIETLPTITDTRENVYVIPNEGYTFDTEYKVKVPFEPIYSYKQLQNDEPVMTYTAHNNPDVSVNTVLKVRTALPKCIKQRIDQVVLFGANPYTVDPLSTKIRPQYPEAEADHEKYHLTLPKLTQPHHNTILRPKLTEFITAKRIPLTNGDRSGVATPIVHPVTNMDQAFRGDKTIGLIPPPYIPHIEKNKEKTEDTMDETNEVKLTNTPVIDKSFSSYVYKQLNHHSPYPSIVVKVGDQIGPNVNTNINPPISNYVYIPPKVNEPLAYDDNVATESKHDDVTGYFRKHPIVVSDKTFSYHQSHSDGSSISINGNNKGVSVDVKNVTVTNNRGDIPDQLM